MSLRREKETPVASNTDLFGWLDALYTKVTPTGTPPTYMMHRFMASDPDLAQFARILQVQLRESMLIFKTWQALLPRGRGAPRFGYVVAKKPPEEEELITKMRSVLSERRDVCEIMLHIVRLAGREKDLYAEFGLLPPGTKTKAVVKPAPPKQGGLLAGIKR